MKIKDRWHKDSQLEFENLLLEAEDQMTRQRDIDFVQSMRSSFKKYGVHTWCSDAQLDWLRKIAGMDDGIAASDEGWDGR